MNELGHLSGTTLSNAILDNTTDHTITKTKSSNVLYIFSTARLRVSPLNSISLKSIRPTRAGDRKPHVASLKLGTRALSVVDEERSDVSLRTAVR